MSGTEEMFPNGTTTAKHGTELREALGNLMKGEELPDLVHPCLAHEPGGGVQPVNTRAGG